MDAIKNHPKFAGFVQALMSGKKPQEVFMEMMQGDGADLARMIMQLQQKEPNALRALIMGGGAKKDTGTMTAAEKEHQAAKEALRAKYIAERCVRAAPCVLLACWPAAGLPQRLGRRPPGRPVTRAHHVHTACMHTVSAFAGSLCAGISGCALTATTSTWSVASPPAQMCSVAGAAPPGRHSDDTRSCARARVLVFAHECGRVQGKGRGGVGTPGRSAVVAGHSDGGLY